VDLEWVVALVVFAADYALVAWVAHRRGSRARPRRYLAFAGGLTVIGVALLSPIEHLALTSMLSFHLLQNVMIADWAPPLLVLGLLPSMRSAVDAHPIARTVTEPRVALTLWLTAWYVIHLPVIYDYALENRWALGVEHLVFIATGLAFWWPDIVPGHLASRRRVIYLFVAMTSMMPLDVFIALYPHALYGFYAHTSKLGGMSALTDQRVAGATAVLAETAVFALALIVAAVDVATAHRRRSATVEAQQR
jgi:cytochrome c oxidase assembly factor CtaG